jgi:Zn-dependent peptidase ImmA (M78 family)
MESGQLRASADVVSALTLLTGFTAQFFSREPCEVPLGSLLFRGRTRISAAERRAAHRLGEVTFELATALREQLIRPDVRLPRLVDLEFPDPARAAAITRSSLGLDPETPVSDLVRTLERAGVLVLSLPVAGGRHDAYSFWGGPALDIPVIVLFRGVPPDRLRFSVAHELGHLVLHRAPTPNVEREAHAFASHFLLPDDAVLREFPRPLTLTDVARLKPRWGVAMQAVVMAAARAGVIDDRQKRQLFQQISRRGWRKAEPGAAVALERPRGLPRMAELLYGSPPDARRVASDAGLPLRLVAALLDQDVVLMSLGDPEPEAEDRAQPATVVELHPRLA